MVAKHIERDDINTVAGTAIPAVTLAGQQLQMSVDQFCAAAIRDVIVSEPEREGEIDFVPPGRVRPCSAIQSVPTAISAAPTRVASASI